MIKKNKKYKVMLILLIVIISLGLIVIGYMNLPKFGRAPQGERLDRIRKSPNYHNGAFQNQHLTPQFTSEKGQIEVMFDFLFGKKERTRPVSELPTIKSNLHQLDKDKNLFVWFGHSSYLIQADGKRIVVDPVFDQASPVSFFNKPFIGTDIYSADDMPDIDYLIITHDHWDHLDHTTVLKLKDKIKHVVCPLGVGEHFEYWGFNIEHLTELDWNENAILENGVTVHCLPTHHFSGRSFKSNQTLWASFMIETPSQTIYIGGDGGYDTHYKDIARQFPKIDVAILENGQYNEAWKYIHLMPNDLVKAINDLNAKKNFAVHNSKYSLSKHSWDEPLNKIADAAEKDSLSLIMPVIGEIVSLDKTIPQLNRWWKNNE